MPTPATAHHVVFLAFDGLQTLDLTGPHDVFAGANAVRRALETTTDTVDAIAARTGFGTAETMRRTFVRRLSTSPDQYRRRFHRPTPERSPA